MTAPAYDPYTTSTNYAPKYALETLFPAYALTYEDGSVEIRRDFLARIARVIRGITRYGIYYYEGYEALTTIAYQFYGNTTMVHVILIYNSIPHRLEIIPGTVLRIPDLSQLTAFFQTTNKQNTSVSNIGKKVPI